MHTYDLHGISSSVCGSVFHRLTRCEARLGSTVAQRLQHINTLRAEFDQRVDASSKVPLLRENNLVCNGWADLSGALIKASNTRQVCPFVCELAFRFFDSAEPYDVAIRKVCGSLCNIYRILFSAGQFLEHGENAELRVEVARLGKYLMIRRELSRQRDLMYFQIRPKHHWGIHLYEAACLNNPRMTMNYV